MDRTVLHSPVARKGQMTIPEKGRKVCESSWVTNCNTRWRNTELRFLCIQGFGD